MAVKRFDSSFWIISIIIIILDQITKYAIRNDFEFTSKILSIRFVKNYGAGFGILQTSKTFLISVAIVFIIGVIYYYSSYIKDRNETVVAALLFGGVVGNLTDRLVYGFVTDFIDFYFWPSFNIADSALTIGAIGLVYLEWKLK